MRKIIIIKCSASAKAAEQSPLDQDTSYKRRTKAPNFMPIIKILISEIYTRPTPPWWKSTNPTGSPTSLPSSTPRTKSSSTRTFPPQKPPSASLNQLKSISGKEYHKLFKNLNYTGLKYNQNKLPPQITHKQSDYQQCPPAWQKIPIESKTFSEIKKQTKKEPIN